MVQIEAFFVFLFGLCFGSFLNVLVYRLNHGKNPLWGQSFCPRCKKRIVWYDNLPIVSFLALGGKCRSCHRPISWQYPLVELATAILAVIVFFWSVKTNHFPTLLTAYYFFCLFLLLTIFVSDLIYQTIPDELSYPLIAVSLLKALIDGSWGAVITGVAVLVFFLFLHLATRGRGMALGDVKLSLFLGIFLGWTKILTCLYLAFTSGALIGLVLIIFKKKSFGQKIAFGPFLVFGAYVALFYSEKMIKFF